MLAVCKTIGSRDFCPSLVKLHIAQLTSSNRNTNPSLADQVYNANEWRLHIFNQAYRERYACEGQYSLSEIGAFQNRRRRGSSVLQLTIVECMPNLPPVYLSPPGRRKIDLFLQYGLEKKIKKNLKFLRLKGLVWTKPYNCKEFRTVNEQEKESRKL